MIKKHWILFFAGLVLGATTVVLWLNFSKGFSKAGGRVTDRIGWWSYQEDLVVKSAKVSVLKNGFPGLFNSGKAIVELHIMGEMKGSRAWRPYISEIHISERLIQIDERPTGDMLVTPIVQVTEDSNYNGELAPFDVKTEYEIQAMGWGCNRFIFKCGDLNDEVELCRTK